MALTTIKTSALPDDAITTAKLADDAITSAKIADDAVVTAAIADDAVTGANIADDTIAEANMANDAISLTELKAGTDGQIISWDASGNPVAVGPGTDGQVLTSTGAGSPPAFETLPTSGATLSGSTNNTVVTVTGANAMAGEANLTFDGNKLSVTPNKNTNSDGFEVVPADGTTASSFKVLGNNNAGADGRNGGATFIDANYYATSSTIFNVAGRGTNVLEVFGDGNVEISDGNLVIGTAGHGIDFSAQTPTSATGASNTAEVLDHYEYGTWTPVVKVGSTVNSGTVSGAVYTRIGDLVCVQCSIIDIGDSGSGNISVEGQPFTRTQGDPTGILRWAGVTSNGRIWPYISSNKVEFQDGNSSGYVGSITHNNLPGGTWNIYSLQMIYHCS